jgi:hypothetical protein
MPKLTLQIEDLAVESFHTVSDSLARGTVIAADSDNTFQGGCSTHETACPEYSCVVNSQCCQSQDPTCLFSCPQGCTGGVSADCYPTQVC